MTTSKIKFFTFSIFSLIYLGCTHTNVNFNYYPTEPKVGQTIRFSNTTKHCDKFYWDFGDGTSAGVENPTKIYNSPGIYYITLTVDGKRHGKITKELTIADSLPRITHNASDTSNNSLPLFTNISFATSIYIPNANKLKYQWNISPNNFIPLSPLTDSICTLYFNNFTDTVLIKIQISDSLNNRSYNLYHKYNLRNLPLTSLLFKTNNNNFKMRLFSINRQETPKTIIDPTTLSFLEQASDTQQIYNGKLYNLNDIEQITKEIIEGFAISTGKIYYRTQQYLKVINIDGTYKTTLFNKKTTSLCIDNEFERLCFATEQEIFTLPLILTNNNNTTFTPSPIFSSHDNIQKITHYNIPTL